MTASPAITTNDGQSVSLETIVSREGHGGDLFELRLITDARDGCQESFRILVERHQEAIFRLCCQLLGCPEDAREACQDTFVRAHDSLPRFKLRARFSTWLYRVALNLCRDRLRMRSARKRRMARCDTAWNPLESNARDGICRQPGPDESLSLAEDLEKLGRGMNRLPEKLREALILVAVEGLSHRECAEILGCSIRAVEGRVYRARKDLLDWWERGE